MRAIQQHHRSRRRPARRAGWLLALVAVLVLHPVATAGEGSSHGLAELLKQLLCGCASCEGETPAQVERSCCDAAPQEAPAQEPGCESDGGCPCAHPDEVPVPERGPLAVAGSAAQGDEPASGLRVAQLVASLTPASPACLASFATDPRQGLAREPVLELLRVARAGGSQPAALRETRERLALYCTALI